MMIQTCMFMLFGPQWRSVRFGEIDRPIPIYYVKGVGWRISEVVEWPT